MLRGYFHCLTCKSNVRVLSKEAFILFWSNQVCRTMDDLMDGTWVADPTLILGYHETVRPNNDFYKSDGIMTWSPNTCLMKVYPPEKVLEALNGTRIFFIGDSTTHELMQRVAYLILGPKGFVAPTNPKACGHNNRVFDSEDLYPFRFTFSWVGNANPCWDNQGLPSIVDDAYGRNRTIHTLSKDADFIIMGTGLHEIFGNVPLEYFYNVSARAFNMILEATPKIDENRQRLIWRTATSIQHLDRRDRHSLNGYTKWLNLLASKRVRE